MLILVNNSELSKWWCFCLLLLVFYFWLILKLFILQATLTGDEHVINVKYSIAKVANDYVKRKHVLRLMLLNGTEYLVQTESHASMMEWLKALQIFTREISEVNMKIFVTCVDNLFVSIFVFSIPQYREFLIFKCL